MLELKCTPQMKDYLRKSMVLTDFELKVLLKIELKKLKEQVRKAENRIAEINEELKKYEGS